ncbi:helix-turn-helix transcriptional regulator [Nocardiopsis sp. NPDC050513]|uniref:helix-turn-helix transcriptional regulator n=1 Tax=Nocardiopsis sp. NPDC050513 TaxID=3364338 RepID=UPI00378CA52C
MLSDSPSTRPGTENQPHTFAGCLHFPVPAHDRRSLEGLTHREREVLTLVGAGWSNRQVARRLGVTERTVKAHVTRILEKLAVRSRLEAALVVVAHHWTRSQHGDGRACDCGPDPESGRVGARVRGASGDRASDGEAR